MQSRFAINGHPIHPLLVTIPIGLFLWALASFVVFRVTADDIWYDVSYWTAIAAVVGALLAALPGFGDYLALPLRGRTRVTATTHMLLDLSIVALYIAGILLMVGDDAKEGVARMTVLVLYAVGTGALLVSGWLGGEMVYREHVAGIPSEAEARARIPESR